MPDFLIPFVILGFGFIVLILILVTGLCYVAGFVADRVHYSYETPAILITAAVYLAVVSSVVFLLIKGFQ